MRILVLSNVFPPGFVGGYELGARDVAVGLERRGHVVRVLTSAYFLDEGDGEGAPLPEVQRTLRCATLSHERMPPERLEAPCHCFHNIRILGSALRAFRPDMVLAFNLQGLGVFGLIRFLQAIRMPLVLHLMDDVFSIPPETEGFRQRYEAVCGPLEPAETTRVIAMSRTIAEEAGRTLGKPLERVVYVPGWIDDSAPRAAPAGRRGLRRRFAYCSRVTPHKGIDTLLAATAELVSRGGDFTIDVWGAGHVSEMVHKVTSLGLTEVIRYRGVAVRERVPEILADYDALLFPTWRREPFGFVVLEAAAAGCLPVMTSGIGASEWFLDGHDCLKIAPAPAALRAAMEQLILCGDDELERLRTAAFQTAWRWFGFSRWLDRIETVCTDAAGQREEIDLVRATRGAEAAMLFLGELAREGG